MNPVDHPHGGRTNGGISPRTPGVFNKRYKTVKNIKSLIVKKKKKNNNG